MRSKILGTCSSGKKMAPARNAPGLVRMGFYQNPWISILGSISRFGSKDLSNLKDDKTKDDAMIGVYPSECPKPILPLTKIRKLRELV